MQLSPLKVFVLRLKLLRVFLSMYVRLGQYVLGFRTIGLLCRQFLYKNFSPVVSGVGGSRSDVNLV